MSVVRDVLLRQCHLLMLSASFFSLQHHLGNPASYGSSRPILAFVEAPIPRGDQSEIAVIGRYWMPCFLVVPHMLR